MRAKRANSKKKYDSKAMPKFNAMLNEKIGSDYHDVKTQAACERFHRPAYCMKGEQK